MPLLMTADIKDEVRKVLEQVKRSDDKGRNFLTAYQVLDRLPEPIKSRLIAERGIGGEGFGHPTAAPTLVSQTIRTLGNAVEILSIDAGGISVSVNQQSLKPSNESTGIYRLKDTETV